MRIRTSWGNSCNNKEREVVEEKRGVPLKMTPHPPQLKSTDILGDKALLDPRYILE